MIYRFKLVSDEVNDFYRVIEIDSEGTFLQLREAILDSVGYTKDNVDSFSTCDEDWKKRDDILLEDLGLSSSDCDVFLMENTTVGELIEEERQKLVFTYDNFNERAFFMELKEIVPGKDLDKPVCTQRRGNPPVQESEEILDIPAPVKKVDDPDTTFLDDIEGGYNEEDTAGFSEFNF